MTENLISKIVSSPLVLLNLILGTKINAKNLLVCMTLYLLITQESNAGTTTTGHRTLIYIYQFFTTNKNGENIYCEYKGKIFRFLNSSLQEFLLLKFIMILIILGVGWGSI
jgi:hypothetical protein